MIFVTTGTQLPFPRLIGAVEALAGDLGDPIVAQVGPDPVPRVGIEIHATLTPDEFGALVAAARVIVAHAGIGSILTAREARKPLIILPRRHGLGEHRNDHQMATARRVADLAGIHVAWDEAEIGPLLAQDLAPAEPGLSPDSQGLIDRVRDYLSGEGPSGDSGGL